MTVQVIIPWRDTGCPHRSRAWQWVRRRWPAVHPDIDLLTTSSPDGPFAIAAALNTGLRRSTADVVVLSGADVVLDPAAVATAVALAEGGRWVMLAGQYRRLAQPCSDMITAGPVDIALPHLRGERMATRLGWGPIVAPRDLLLEVGYDERFRGWGGEDDAFGIAAHALAGPAVHVGATAVMLWHPRKDRHDHPDYRANLDLLARYRAAAKDPDAIRALIAERPPRPPCDFRSMGMACTLERDHRWEPHTLVSCR